VSYRYECLHCIGVTEVHHEGPDVVCTNCDEICDRVRVCDGCDKAALVTEEFCAHCLASHVIDNPPLFRTLLPSTRTEVGIVLANRLRPKLSSRQAA
jgi:hypothetical protein